MHRTRSIFRIPSHAQDQEHQHGTYAAGLPGICNVNLVSHTMGDGISSVAWSSGVSKPEKPTQGAPARAECPVPARNPLPAARTVRKTHRSLNGGRVPYNGQAGAAIGCSVSATVFSHWTPSLCTHGLLAVLSTAACSSFGKNSPVSWRESGI